MNLLRKVVLTFMLIASTCSFAKNGGGGNGGTGNCNGNGNVRHGCGSSVITPDILTQTSQGNARQRTAPIPTANQLPPVAPVIQPHQAAEAPPLPPQRAPDPVPQASINTMSAGVPQQSIAITSAPPAVVQSRIAVEAPPLPPQRVLDQVPQTSTNMMSASVPMQGLVNQPPPVVQQVPMVVPPKIPQQVPVKQSTEGSPLPPQKVLDRVPPVTANVISPGVINPGLVNEPLRIVQMVPLINPPKVSSETRLNISPPKSDSPFAVTYIKPQVKITPKADSATFNRNMIANNPGRQDTNSPAVFKNEATGAYRECVVSGLERRKVVMPNGDVIYREACPA